MRAYRRFETVQQMSLALGVFAALGLLLESGGIYRWAQRLELGPERSIAMPAATALHRGLGWLGYEQGRTWTLTELARVGWSDDPEALREAVDEAKAVSKPASPGRVPASGAGNASVPAVAPAVMARKAALPRTLEGAPPLLSKLPEIDRVEAGKTRTVALAGDSMMAVGLSSAILREGPKYKDLTFLKAFKSGTGLARPEVFDWQQEYPAMLRDARPDFVVVAIGANDGQGFVEDGVIYPFGTDGWQEIYQRRVAAYLEMLETSGATVVWLGLPPMKSDVYDAKIALVNRIDATVVNASPHAIWFSTAGIVGDESGRFRDFGEVSGRIVRVRQGDGIHLSDDGAALVAAKLLPWLAAQEPETTQSAKVEAAQ